MKKQKRFLLEEDQIPRQWYNIHRKQRFYNQWFWNGNNGYDYKADFAGNGAALVASSMLGSRRIGVAGYWLANG